ncbi:tetratricopeptide repeat protein [Persephonella atlantica]|uniref:Tetratricopeptide repeat protein n=1 Tax=Persephonella atlantica TaxID=2699429 RepID=A0ABS1GFB7_9AQUI|nr:tetratricopeptide repeat protein [Persephonella atlantica]MBK3331622.1 tetratricopeptide repeat protein [Persephonella atlantica]
MSLIIDSLKKLRKDSTSKSIPPNLKSKSKNLSVKKVGILGSIIILLSFSFVVLKILENKFIISKNSLYLPVREKNIKKASTPEKPHKKLNGNKIVELKSKKENKSQESSEKYQEGKRQLSQQQTEKKKLKHKRDNTEDIKRKYVLYITLANKYLKKGNYTESLKFYQKAYSIKPEERVLTNIIILKIGAGEGDIKEIEKIKDTENIYKIALFAINRNRSYLVEKFIKKRLSTDSSGILHYLLGIIYEKNGQLIDAEEEYKKAFELNQTDPYVSYAYGRILEINKKYRLSRKIYEYTLKIIKSKDTKLRKTVSERLKILGGSYE